MANRRNYGGGNNNYGGGGYGGGNNSRFNSGPSNVNPWQQGASPNRIAPSLLGSSLLSQLASPESQLALASKIISSILPLQQDKRMQGPPPSLMSLGGPGRFSGGGGGPGPGGYGNDRFRRDDRRPPNNDQQFRNQNRRPPIDRKRERKSGGESKGRFEKGRKPEEVEQKEKDASKEDSQAKDDANQDEDNKVKAENEGPLPGYENIPSKLFHCHICGKTMWNDVSFDTHVNGRNHRNKLRDLDESYQLQTDLMRQIAAISLKLEEVRRGKRRPYPEQYCKMCDLHFNGMTMFAHRSTEEHQSLKRFIHPNCELCNLDFQVRLEYDEHILTAPHLQQEAKALLRRAQFDKDPKYQAVREKEAKLRLLLEETENVALPGTGPTVSDEDKKLLSTLGEEGAVPAYDPDAEQGVARQHITPVEGFLCKVCRVFLPAEETADVHSRTQKHYAAYVAQLKSEASKRQKDKDREAGDKRKLDSNGEAEDPKRRKSEQDGEDESGVNGEAEDAKADEDVPMKDVEETAPAAETPAATPAAEAAASPAKPKQSPRRGRGRGRRY